ncbi:MAG: quinone-dependent dihydroorotate dehydrogenase [Kordiimonadaceae bacterium]|nr:quinone-dependent dihydroorotate dehydrogenase [Kordiimonadaceae bacterium]MBO6568402.1 quinone-dependent dihydroorotate dehydrogenase [Kordiimonadaceae bacterium]MBO6963869.1 quinone-dependent dihydroorotate dehydrogenase [Kordiimonadaceae bacterium]
MIDLFPFARPFIHSLDPEKAHTLTINMLRRGITGVPFPPKRYRALKTDVFGLTFDNPVGLAAGFDKDAEALAGAQRMGFGFVEAGTVTPKPQPGNEKPRLFRLSADRAVINRFGFNNKGVEAFAKRLQSFKPPYGPNRSIVGANVGANKEAKDRTADYVTCIERLYGLSDYFTVNISSPNTPGLRALQSRASLENLISRVLEVREKKVSDGMARVPMLVKIAPDLTEEDVADIAAIALASDIDGLIVSNTTIERPEFLKSADKTEMGGLSGKPLFEPSTDMLAKVYKATDGKIPLVGVGGISSGADAYAKIRAGASLVQLYSMLVYEGPGLVERVKKDLNKLLKKDGFATVAEAVGADHTG